MNLLQFATHLIGAAATMEVANREAMEKAALVVQNEAKHVLGEYQAAAGPYPAWQPLSPSTVADKATHGHAPPDNPLVATGQLRDSIHHHVGYHEAVIGTNDGYAVMHEMGTKNEPPRPFLGVAAVHKEHEVAHIIGERIFQHIVTRRIL